MKDFVPYSEALVLRILGFDESCVYYVDKDNNIYIYNFETNPDEFIEKPHLSVNIIFKLVIGNDELISMN